MKNINIFIAGSKSLTNYREKLVLWANEKNYNYRERNDHLQLNIYSFKEVGDDQDTYNRVIKSESDIILFLVEGMIGDRTKEELENAKKSYRYHNRPEIWVFVNQADANTMSYIEGSLGREYAIDFNSAEDLVNQVNRRIDNYTRDKIAKHTNKINTDTGRMKMLGVAILIFLLSLILVVGVGKYCFNTYLAGEKQEKPMLLIAGGGSVANFIEAQPGTLIPSLADYPNGYFLHLPTKSAWKMLVEEVVSLQDTRRYYPVCISATEATDEDFCSAQISKQMFLDSAIVVSCKLGEDSLAVYVQKGCEFLQKHPECMFSKHISVTQLKDIIINKEMNVFSTSFESGTRAGYCEALGIDNQELNNYLAGQFSEFSAISSVSRDSKSYILLGSQYYQMKAVKNDAIRLTVSSAYAKPMMVYFMAYRVTNDIYRIPQESIEFLEHLKYHALDDYISSDGCIKIKNHNHVIYNEKDLIENSSK